MTFDPRAICRVLDDEGVRYVVVGGLAAVLHGSSLPTADIDIVPDRVGDNLGRLARALVRLGARLRTRDGTVAVPMDEAFLRSMEAIVNLTTTHGDIDLTFVPAGPLHDHRSWDAGATSMDIGDGLVIRVARLDDVIASKRAANRPKDVAALPYLESLREQIDGG